MLKRFLIKTLYNVTPAYTSPTRMLKNYISMKTPVLTVINITNTLTYIRSYFDGESTLQITCKIKTVILFIYLFFRQVTYLNEHTIGRQCATLVRSGVCTKAFLTRSHCAPLCHPDFETITSVRHVDRCMRFDFLTCSYRLSESRLSGHSRRPKYRDVFDGV